jgi:putative FmdB family regulatory protein
MPLYDYCCTQCGPFREWGAMSEAAAPAPCPGCGIGAPRTITAPSVSTLSGANRVAHSRNEKSADEPRVVSRTDHESSGTGGHSHGHAHTPKRPWMIGH